MGTTHRPQATPTPETAPTERPEGPRELQNSSRRKRQEQQAPPPRHPSMGLSKQNGGGSRGWKCPPLLRALTPGREAAHPALALQGMLGSPEGRCSPPSTFLLLPRSLILSCPYSTGNGRRPSSSAPCQGSARLGNEVRAVVARLGTPVKLWSSTLGNEE